MSYVGTSFEFPSLFNMTFRLFPLFAFQAIMGNSYYDYFCTGSVYYFSRCQLRKKWLAKKQFELLLASILYSAFLLVPSLLILIMQQRLMLSRTAWTITEYYVAIFSLWLFITTTTINFLSLKIKEVASYAFVIGSQLLLVMALKFCEPENGAAARLLSINPIAHLILSWHNSPISEVDFYIHQIETGISLNDSVAFFLGLSSVAVFVSIFIVCRQEIISSNIETEVA